ncbi:hypothetical protein [Caulobacter sp.]|uniref:hypothetical protein n=1 Tax=Caulobacter sp. TaxID=78 RepID=UPI002B4A0DDE|nr:hypothetical protein [Caulobacter sp.]HJV43898.1 hypothetical protein [Caulobacter sp.]
MRYLFRFGFESPDDFAANRAGGWDDESSEAVWIDAASAEEALSWGRSVAERFVQKLFEIANVEGYSWKTRGFATWIEDDASVLAWARTSPEVLATTYGQMPDLTAHATLRSG